MSDIPTRADLLSDDVTYGIQRDMVMPGRRFVVQYINDKTSGPIAIICSISTSYPEYNELIAETIVEGLRKLQDEHKVLEEG